MVKFRQKELIHKRSHCNKWWRCYSAPVATGVSDRGKGTQRERLIAGMIAATRRYGYEGANVSQVIAGAGVSRPTFYEYFADKDDCFRHTHSELADRLIDEVGQAIAAAPPGHAPQATIRCLVELAEALPDRASLLVNETMAGGLRALDAHDALIDRMVALVEAADARVAPDVPSPDLPVKTALGAGRWLLALALRRGERDLAGLRDELIGWVELYERPREEHRWRVLEPASRVPSSPHFSPLPLVPPPSLSRGRPRQSAAETARNQRERILYATAKLSVSDGYNNTTVAGITAAAGVDRRVFYRHFRDRQQAFLAIHELAIQHVMTLAAAAFFSAEEWPERVWAAMLATTQFEAEHPVVSYLGHVESHALGAPAIQRIDDSRAAFTIFLQEGSRYTESPPTRTAMEAVAGAVFEIGYQQARAGQIEQVSRLAPHAAYLALAPFMGPARASEFVDAKLAEPDG